MCERFDNIEYVSILNLLKTMDNVIARMLAVKKLSTNRSFEIKVILVVKSKLSSRSGFVALKQLNPIHKKRP